MNLRSVRRRALRTFALALTAASLGVAAPLALADSLQFSAPDNVPMISLTREHGMVRGVVDTPLVQVFGDGRVRVERPAYMIAAGVHEFALSSDELERLVAQLSDLVDLNTDVIALRREVMQRSTGERFATLDETTTRIALKFDALGRNGEAARSVDQTVSLSNVQIDAERFAQIEELATLARAERALLELAQQPMNAKSAEGQSND